MQERVFTINKIKAEGLFYAIFIIVAFIGFLSLFSFSSIALIAFGLVISTIFIILKKKLSGQYFIKINDKGIEFRSSIFKKPALLPWDYVDKVSFHIYEINFRLRETNRVINFQTNYLKSEDVEIFTKLIKEQFARVNACDKIKV